jgi:hypothetical protein
MPPLSVHVALGKYELAFAFGKTEPASDDVESSEAPVELMPIMSESERDHFGFARYDRPECY